MLNFYEKAIYLPKVPHSIIHHQKDIESMEVAWENHKGYKSLIPPKKFCDYIQSFFDFEVIVRYQLIYNDLGIHTDFGIKGTKFLYNIDTGGDVITRWHDKNNKIIKQVKFKPETWYEMNIEIPHSISGVTSYRRAITARRP